MDFEDVASQIDSWVTEDAVNGASIAIWHQGELVTIRHAGEAQPGVRVDDTTLFGLASLSKPMTAATVLSVCDKGLLDLDTPVVEILHEFGAEVDSLQANAMLEAQRDDITFRQLLAHISGMPENFDPTFYHHHPLPSRDEQIDAMLQTPLTSAPGERLRYSNIGPGIAARAAEILTGKGFHTLTLERILQPLELRNTILAPKTDYDDRIATLQEPGNPGTERETYNSPWWRSIGVPWGGYYGSAEDMVRFAVSFLPGEHSPLSATSKREMVSDQAEGVEGGVESMYTHWTPAFWGLGWEIKGTKPRHWTGTKTSPETWLHWGFAGTLAWVDPTRELGVAVFATRSVVSQWMFKPARWITLSDDLCSVADEMA